MFISRLLSGNWVWINLQDYTKWELSIYGLGCFLWVIVYIIYARRVVKERYIEMPVFAGCSDIGWEFVWGFLFYTNMGMLFQVGTFIWFFLDLFFIFSGILRFGEKQLTDSMLKERKIFVPSCVFIAVFFGLATYYLKVQGFETPIGAHAAWISNLFIAFLYIPLMLRRKNVDRTSYAVAWLKMLGTGFPGIFAVLHYGLQDRFMVLIAVVTTTVDCSYIYFFLRRLRQEKAQEVERAARVSAASTRSFDPQPSVNVG